MLSGWIAQDKVGMCSWTRSERFPTWYLFVSSVPCVGFHALRLGYPLVKVSQWTKPVTPEQFLLLLRRTRNELHSRASRKFSLFKIIELFVKRNGTFRATEQGHLSYTPKAALASTT